MSIDDLRRLPLSEILDLGAWNGIVAGPAMLENPELASEEAQRAFVRTLFTDVRYAGTTSMFGRNARKIVVYRVVGRRDQATLDLLVHLADDPAHPLRTEALEELLATRDRTIVAPLYERHVPAVLDGCPFGGYTHRLGLAAAYVMGAEAVKRDLVPRYLTEANGLQHASGVIFELIHQIGAGNVAKDDPELVAAVVALTSVQWLKKPVQKLLAVLDRDLVARARSASSGGVAEPAPGRKKKAASEKAVPVGSVSGTAGGWLARYEAGEHRAVWAELRALGANVRDPAIEPEARAVAVATMKGLAENVARIARVLKKARYTLAWKKAVATARRDAPRKLEALSRVAGPLPLTIEAFYQAFDGISLAQDVDAPIDGSPVFSEGLLDELGGRDPLIVARLSDVLHDAEAQRAQGATVCPYLAPDPACKGTIDDEIPDENPVRFVAGDGFDAALSGGADGYFLDWLAAYVDAGGFLDAMNDDDRAKLQTGRTGGW